MTEQRRKEYDRKKTAHRKKEKITTTQLTTHSGTE
jgi:hypothetical protein